MRDGFAFRNMTYPVDGSVIRDVSLDLGPEERVAVLGRNGAGKTTLLRAIAGTHVGAERIDDVAYAPQTPFLFRGTARRNLQLGADPSRAVELATELGLGEILDQPRDLLSGGEAQRLALARVLSGGEPLVLLDEPMAAIDAEDREAVISLIRRETEGRAMILVTHSVDNAVALAETLVVLDRGVIVQHGPIEDTLAMPDRRVADLTGIANVLHGVVTSTELDLSIVEIAGMRLSVVGDHPVGVMVTIKIPASSIAVFRQPPRGTSHRNVVAGTIDRIVERDVLVEVGMSGPVPLVALITHGALDALELGEGVDVWFGVKTAAIEVVRTG